MNHYLHKIRPQKIRKLLNQMAHMGEVPQIKTFRKAVTNNGGTYVVPQSGDRTGSHLVEVCLYGVPAMGRDEAEAVVNWQRCARRALDAADPPRPVADVAVQVTTHNAGVVATVQVLVPGDTPAIDLVSAAARALVSQTHMDPQNIARVSITAMQSNARTLPLDEIMRTYSARQERARA